MFNQIDERGIRKFQRENVITDSLIKRLQLFGTLEGHESCVNCIEWNYSGTKLCSVGDDCNIILWDPFKKKKLTQFHSNHTGNIFAAKFLEHNHENLLVTGSADCKTILHDLVTHDHLMICECHRQRVKKIATQSYETSLFWSAGEDGKVLQTDIRTNHTCNQDKISNVLIDLTKHCGSSSKITSVACNPVRREYIAVGSNDQFVRLYDRRMIRIVDITSTYDNLPQDCVKYFTIGIGNSTKKKTFHSLACTSLSFSQTGDELLASISSDNIYLFNILHPSKPKIFSTDLSSIFGSLSDDELEFNMIDDYSSSSDVKRLKASASNVSQSSNSSSCSSVIKLSKNCKISKESLNSTLDTSNASMNNNDSSHCETVSSNQMPSTSKAIDMVEDAEIDEELERKSKKIIKAINKRQKPNLIKLKTKAKMPKHIAPLYKNAEAYFKKNKYSDSIELINELIELMPNVSRFYCLRANAYINRKWNRDLYCALKDFYRSLEIDSNNKESHLKLAECLHDLGYYENAYQCLNYFRQKQSKDTRYKEFKELEKKVLSMLKQNKPNDDKKPTEIKSKAYFLISHNSVSNNADQLAGQSISSSSSSSTSTSSSTVNSFLDHTEPLSSDNEEHNVSTNRHSSPSWVSDYSSDSFQMSQDSSIHEVERIKSKKELQWRSNSYDFEQRFYGHCNVSTDIMEASWFGSDSQYVVGGSDDGNFYIWNRKTGNIVNILKADECIVNCVQPHYNSCFIATSGIDSNIKLWTPTMSEEDLKEKEKTRKLEIRQKSEENQKKKTNSNGFGIMFLRIVRNDSNDSSESDDDDTIAIREAALNRDCLPS